MRITREVSTFVMPEQNPHLYLRVGEGDERFPAYCVWPLLRTTKPLGISATEEHFVEEGDELKIRLRLCVDRKPPNPALRLSRRDGSDHDEGVIWDYLRLNAGLIPAIEKKENGGGKRIALISALPKDKIKKQVTLVNVFEVIGTFIIQDVEVFARAYTQGVGRRFSYGYGLIEIIQ